jgi:hypothetical protein
MKKLLLGSALAASVLFTGASFAETKISGYLETTYNTKKTKTASTVENASPGTIGHEGQIAMASSKALTNGLTMSAGFAIEQDTTTVVTDQFLKLSSGGTSFAIGNDVSGVADNVSHEDFTPNVAQDIHLTGVGGVDDVESVHGGNGLYLAHKTDMFTIEGVYAPSGTATTGAETKASASNATSGSGYDLAIHGGFGVPGLKIGYGISEKTADSSVSGDVEGKGMGIMYSNSGFTVGVGRVTNTDASSLDTENTSYGISYQVNKQITVAVTGGKQEKDGQATDTDYQTFQVGYDFGGLGITAGLYQVDNSGYAAGTDAETFEIRTVTKF